MLLPTVARRFELNCRHVNMASTIDAPVNCQLRIVMGFIEEEGNIAADIH